MERAGTEGAEQLAVISLEVGLVEDVHYLAEVPGRRCEAEWSAH